MNRKFKIHDNDKLYFISFASVHRLPDLVPFVENEEKKSHSLRIAGNILGIKIGG
jgi:hypothetical protein